MRAKATVSIFVWSGDEIIFLLCGGNKKSQHKDIALASVSGRELGNGT